MLSRLEVRTRQGDLLALPLDDPSQGFVVQEIGGLDPVAATLVSSSFAQMDGAQYHSSRREPRNITLKLGLEPDYNFGTVRDLRKSLYNFFMPKSAVTLQFHLLEGDGPLDFLDLTIEGRVETFESPLFAQTPVVDISLMCYDPDFIDKVPVTVAYPSTAGLDERTVPYLGEVDTGVEFVLRPDRDISSFSVFHRPPDGSLRTMDFEYPLKASDVLRISTVRGAKYVTLTRGGLDTSVLYALSPQSDWLALQPGQNHVRVYVEGAPVPYEINYTTRYGGL